jgi:hypothetical protein
MGMAWNVALQRALGRLGVAVERQLAEHGRGHERRGAGEEPSAREFSHA